MRDFSSNPILASHVAMAQADVKIPFVDTRDIADVVVEALLHDEHNSKIYQLTGQRGLTFKEAIAEIRSVTGRDITFTSITVAEYSKMLEEHKVPGDYVWLINYLFTEVLGNPMVSEMTDDIEKILKRKPIDFSDYVRETAELGVWNLPEAITN